jgi:hypothetical protein
MIGTEVALYLVSRARIARLKKTIMFSSLPRVHEFVKVRNRKQGDYFAFMVAQVTHREGDSPVLWLHMTGLSNGRSVVCFFDDSELDEYVVGYQQEGWVLASLLPNRTFRDTGESIWSELPGADSDSA